MTLIATYSHEGKPQRALVQVKNTLYRRITATINPYMPLDMPLWQEKIHTGEFHNVISPESITFLEKEYNELMEKGAKMEREAIVNNS